MAENANEGLDRQSVTNYWESVSVPLARLFEVMSAREYWIDSESGAGLNPDLLIEMLEGLIERFEDDVFVSSLDKEERSAALAHVLSYANMPLFVRTLVLIDSKKNGIVSRLAHAMAKVSGEPEIFVDLYFERMQVVLQAGVRGQIFSVQRLKQLAETIRYLQGDAL